MSILCYSIMADTNSSDIFAGPLFALITGASQGLGRSFVVGLAARVAKKSVIAITARNADGLKETSKLAKEHRKNVCQDDDIKIVCTTADLSDFKDMESLVDSCVLGHNNKIFATTLLIHTAGSLGDLSKDMIDFLNPREVTDYFTLNLAPLPAITGRFLKWAKGGDHTPCMIVVNVSSLFAVQASPCFSLYCSGKAARDMLFKTLAIENPEIRVLNWAPGPLPTDMMETIIKTATRHNSAKAAKKLKDDGGLLTCEESTRRFLTLLQKNEYESGQHVDAFDC